MPITETSKIQIRADLFNSLNDTNLNGLRTSLNDAFFGQLLSTAGARVAGSDFRSSMAAMNRRQVLGLLS